MNTFANILIIGLATISTFAAATNKNIEVIALEYPPFTTLTTSSGGIAFEILTSATSGVDYAWQPYFLPPKRAHQTIKSGNWCASFYPANMSTSFIQYQLSEQTVSVGLVRRKKSDRFNWVNLNELEGSSVAILSTNINSPFARQFTEANMTKAQVQTVQAGVQMVLLGRVDYAMLDDVSFSRLETKSKNELQFSESSLLTTKVSFFVNPECKVHLPHLPVLLSQ